MNLREKFYRWMSREPRSTEFAPYDFNRLKYEIRPGDVILIEGRSRISKFIRSVTQSPWTHAALYIGQADDIEDPILREHIETTFTSMGHKRLVVEGLIDKGIVVSPLSHYKNQHIRICRPIGLSPIDAQAVISYALKAVGKNYNVKQFFDLARFLLPWGILPKRWGSSLFTTPSGEPENGICSSLIAEAFTSVQFPILPFISPNEVKEKKLVQRNPYIFTPKDFDYSPYFEIIKYPLFSLEENLPYYRRLPWTDKEFLHQGAGEMVFPKPKKKVKTPKKTSDSSDI